MSDQGRQAAVAVAHTRSERDEAASDGLVKLASGYWAKITPVSASLIDEVTANIKDPEVPVWHNEDKGRDEPNPSDPKYLADLEEAGRLRGSAAIDAIVLFGVDIIKDPDGKELDGGVPEDTGWLRKLARTGIEIDASDRFEVEFAFKKYIAVSADDINLVTRRSGMRQEDVDAAERSFRRKAK